MSIVPVVIVCYYKMSVLLELFYIAIAFSFIVLSEVYKVNGRR